MQLWRLSGVQHATSFDGGYGVLFDGRWNSVGHPVTYCATSPSLCVLEKLVHVEEPALLPELRMVRYEALDDIAIEHIGFNALPTDWRAIETLTQGMGDRWHGALRSPLLMVPSAIVPIVGSPDLNVIINHRHPAAAGISVADIVPFALDQRLL